MNLSTNSTDYHEFEYTHEYSCAAPPLIPWFVIAPLNPGHHEYFDLMLLVGLSCYLIHPDSQHVQTRRPPTPPPTQAGVTCPRQGFRDFFCVIWERFFCLKFTRNLGQLSWGATWAIVSWNFASHFWNFASASVTIRDRCASYTYPGSSSYEKGRIQTQNSLILNRYTNRKYESYGLRQKCCSKFRKIL